MAKPNLSSIIKSAWAAMKKHSPEILTGIGIAGMITTTIMAVRATPKALVLIEEAKQEKNAEHTPVESVNEKEEVLKCYGNRPWNFLTRWETIKAAWPCYIPSILVGTASVLCLVSASSTNLRRNAALATAYTLSETTLKEYQEKVVATIGEKKEQTIRESVAKDKMVNNPVRDVILTEKGGNTVCYDAISGRYFKSDRDKINRVVNELNRQMRNDMYITLNEFYDELGLDGTKMGDMLGWNIDKGYIELDYSSHLDATGIPCLVIDYRIAPVYDYR